MMTRPKHLGASEADIGRALDEALNVGLKNWQRETRHTLQYWLRGYCASFARVLVEFMGRPARLASVLANDGNVHHIDVVLGGLTIDARGVNTEQSLVSEINREAEANDYSLRAVGVIPFELEHSHFLKECAGTHLRKLKACFNTPVMRRLRRRIRMAAFVSIHA
jgi:hypothetical protein